MELYDYSWNQQTSMLYIEAPTGVGFSWSADKAKYASNTDESASLDNYGTAAALQACAPALTRLSYAHRNCCGRCLLESTVTCGGRCSRAAVT